MRLFNLHTIIIIALLAFYPLKVSSQDQPIMDDELLPEQVEVKQTKPIEYKPFDGINPSTLNIGFKSLIYDEDQLNILYKSIEAFKVHSAIPAYNDPNKPDISKLSNKISSDELTEVVTANQNQNQPVEYIAPSFFLSSILYEKPDSWTIWLNDKKTRFENKDTVKDANILAVAPKNIAMLWEGLNLQDKSPNFKEYLEKIKPFKDDSGKYSWDYKSKSGDVYVDSFKGGVKFLIQPGQTFSLYHMRSFEGYVSDVTVKNGIVVAITGDQPELKKYKGSVRSGKGDEKQQKLTEDEGIGLDL